MTRLEYRPEVDRRQVGVAGDGADVERLDAEDLRHASDEHVVRSLADLGRAAERRHAAAAIQLELDGGVRHVVPVNRQARAREVRRAGQSQTAARSELPVSGLPFRGAHDAADALGEADRRDAQVVCRQRVGPFGDAQAKVGGVDLEPLGDLVELNLLAEAALRRPVTALRAAGRLVGEDPAAVEAVPRDVVRDRLQRAGVEGAGDAIRSVRAAVEQRLKVDAGQRPVSLDARPEAHQDGVSAAMAEEDLFAVQRDLDRPLEHERRLRDRDLVVERIALAAEPAAVRRRDDADVRRRHRERLRQRPMHVVRRLRARPEDELAVAVDRGDGGVLLERQVRAPLIEEEVLEDVIRLGEPLLDVAERERDLLVDVPLVSVFVDARLRVREAFFRLGEGSERLVLHRDQIERVGRGQLVARDDERDRIADETDGVRTERVLVLADRQDAVGDWKMAAGQDEMNAGMRLGARRIHRPDARVGHGAPQQPGVQHARQDEVVREDRLAGDLGAAVDAATREADDPRLAVGVHGFTAVSFIPTAAAACTASTIC